MIIISFFFLTWLPGYGSIDSAPVAHRSKGLLTVVTALSLLAIVGCVVVALQEVQRGKPFFFELKILQPHTISLEGGWTEILADAPPGI